MRRAPRRRRHAARAPLVDVVVVVDVVVFFRPVRELRLEGLRLEAGAWFIGAGWAHELAGSGSWATGFVGVPWPLAGVGEAEPWWGVYVEPYWRPAYRLRGEGARWRHEGGVMLKLTTVKIGSWAEPRQ